MNWQTTEQELELIRKIRERLFCLSITNDILYNGSLRTEMDIIICHKNGNELKLEDLLNAPEFDFLHDVLGIIDNIDRKTGKLQNCFSPRYSA